MITFLGNGPSLFYFSVLLNVGFSPVSSFGAGAVFVGLFLIGLCFLFETILIPVCAIPATSHAFDREM